MTKGEAVKAYTERFGNYPYMNMRGRPDAIIIKLIEEALESGKEIEFYYEDDCDY